MLTRFERRDADEVLSWASSADDLERWCGRTDHPLQDPQVLLAWHGPDVTPWVLREGEALVAYGEVWVDPEEAEVELGRLIVAPAVRGRGVGRRLVAGLLDPARESGYPLAYVRVRAENEAALRCYRAAGFEAVDPVDLQVFNQGQPHPYRWLACRL